MKKIINSLLCILILFGLVACKKSDDISASQTGLNESYTSTEESTTYTYKKSDLETDKVETVYVDADPNGNVEKIEVETTLKSKLEGELKDVANLENIINTSGDENYEIKDGIIYFENHGEDITYKGNTNNELPVNVKITYYLDGKEANPSELTHKSGHIKIEFKYSNNTSTNYSNIKVPFICISLIMLDEEKFSNVTVENGKLLTMSDNKIVTLYGEPGLKDSLQLYKVDIFDDIKITDTAYFEADVEDFTLDYTATVISNGLFEDLEDKDINDLSSSINDLNELNTKIDDIKDATNKLKNASNELVSGVSKLNDGTSELNDYIQKYNEGIKGIGTLTDNIVSIASSLNTATSSDTYTLLSTSVSSLKSTISSLKAYVDTLTTIKSNIEKIGNEYESDQTLKDETKEAIKSLKEVDFSNLKLDEITNSLSALETSISSLEEKLNILNISTSEIYKNAFSLNTDTNKKTLIEGMAGIASGSSSLKDGVKALNDNMPKLTDGVNEFSDKLNDAIDDSRDDLNKLSGSNMKSIINNLRNTKKVDSEYDTFVGKLDGMTSSVSFIIETKEIK